MGGIGGALVGGLFSLGGSLIQGNAAESAAQSQADAARQAQAAQAEAIEKAIPELKAAEQKAYRDLLSGYTQAQATTAPFNLAGLGALDLYLQSIGIAPPAGGSTQTSFQLQQALSAESKLKGFQAVDSVDLESSYELLKETITTDVINWTDQYPLYTQGFKTAEKLAEKPAGTWSGPAWKNNPNDAVARLDAAWGAMDTPEKKQQFLDSMSKGLSEATQVGPGHTVQYGEGLANQKARQFAALKGTFTPGIPPEDLTPEQTSLLEQYRSGQLLQPTQPGDTRGLQAFFGSPEYQALYGTTGPAADPTATPLQRFQTSPGYEFAQQQGINAIQRASGPKGLLESGAILKEITAFGTGLAEQEYTNYQNRLQNVFGRYQANLAGLTALGAGFTSAQAAQDYAYGADVSQIGLGTAANVASLYGSLGKSNAEALMAAGNASAQGQLASGAAWASGLAGFGSALGNAFQAQSTAPAAQQQFINPLPAGQIAFGNSSILGAYGGSRPGGFF